MKRALPVAVLLLLSLSGCSNTTRVDPVGAGGSAGTGGNAGTAGTGGESGAPPIETAQPVRTVEQRNPYGNTAIENNLMVDGDFEFTGASGQYGWYAIAQGQQAQLVRETGGLCHSGVACGVMPVGTDFVAQAAAPPGKPMEISLWIKPPSGDCNAVSVSLIECSVALPIVLSNVPPLTSSADSSGWCHLDGTAPSMTAQPCLYLATSEDNVLVDDASLVAEKIPGSGSTALAATVPSPALYARMKGALDWMHSHTLVGRPPPGRP